MQQDELRFRAFKTVDRMQGIPITRFSNSVPGSLVHLSRAAPSVELHAVLGQADVAAVGAQDVEAYQQVDLPVLDHREGAPQVRVPDPDR